MDAAGPRCAQRGTFQSSQLPHVAPCPPVRQEPVFAEHAMYCPSPSQQPTMKYYHCFIREEKQTREFRVALPLQVGLGYKSRQSGPRSPCSFNRCHLCTWLPYSFLLFRAVGASYSLQQKLSSGHGWPVSL